MSMELVDEEVKPFILKGKRTKRHYYSKLVDATSGHGDCVISSTSNYSSEITKNTDAAKNDEDLAQCLILLAQPHLRRRRRQKSSQPPDRSGIAGDDVYPCKTCDRSFGSFQALGGHRTSHKKPRRNQVENNSGSDNQHLYDVVGTCSSSMSLQIPNCGKSISPNKKANRVHECSLCGAEFTSGQALGGHMRRHRPIHPVPPATSDRQDFHVVEKTRSCIFELDLNLPAPTEEDDELESKFKVKSKEESCLVFSASSSLVDCHY